MEDNVINMEKEDKQLIRAIRGPAIQRGTAITFIDASTTIEGDKFNMPLFCDMGARFETAMEKEIKGIKKDKKQEQNKPATTTPAQGNPECSKCKRNHKGECEERKCDHCYANPAPDRQKVKDTHFANQCRYQFPEKPRHIGKDQHQPKNRKEKLA